MALRVRAAKTKAHRPRAAAARFPLPRSWREGQRQPWGIRPSAHCCGRAASRHAVLCAPGAAAEGGAYPAGGDKEGGTAAFARLAALLRAGGFDVQVYPERPGVVRHSPPLSLACSFGRGCT